jgi:hypothetical protein
LNLTGRALSVVAATAVACVLPAAARAGIVFQFAPTNPKAGSKYVTVRAITTPSDYGGVQLPDSAQVVDLYLVRHADAPTVHSLNDPRLIPLGRYDPPKVSNRYRLPRLQTGTYAIAAQCRNCERQTLYVIGVGPSLSGPEPLMLLHASAIRGFPILPFTFGALLVLLVALAAWAVVKRPRAERLQTRIQLL